MQKKIRQLTQIAQGLLSTGGSLDKMVAMEALGPVADGNHGLWDNLCEETYDRVVAYYQSDRTTY